jgi:hypothetical protein
MRIIIINPTERTITEEDVDGQVDYRTITKKIGGAMCVAGTFCDGHTLYVDDEGLLKGVQNYFHMPALNRQQLAGVGVIGGPETKDENQDITSATLSLLYIRMLIVWCGPMIATIESIQHETGDPDLSHLELRPTITPAG